MTDIKENTIWQGESREYKFRAWDWEKMSRIFTMQDIWYEWFPSMCYNFPEERDYIKESIVIMQYTWLKDKNWVEIYEGDVLSSKLWLLKWDVYYRSEWLYEIRWAWWLFEYDMWRFEVIWNIYENPELLSEK